MHRHSINIERNDFGTLARNSLGTDALNAISSIPGTHDVRIEEDGDKLVVISYTWSGPGDFHDTATVLAKHYCKRLEW